MNEVVDVVVDDGQPVSEALNEETFIQPSLSSSEKKLHYVRKIMTNKILMMMIFIQDIYLWMSVSYFQS